MTTMLILLGITVTGTAWFVYRRTRDVACQIDLEATHEHLHAHVTLRDIEVGPGDEVVVHGAPAYIPLGTVRVYDSNATVRQASWVRRQWTRLIGGTEFHELYDVGFEG